MNKTIETSMTASYDNQTANKNTISLIIHGDNKQVCIGSREIAKEFGRRHDNVLQTIRGLIDRGTISLLDCKERDYIHRGKKQPCFELNERAFLIAMPWVGGEKSERGQVRLVDAFLWHRQLMEKQARERETMAFHLARSSGKDSRGILTDAIKNYIAYAKEQGSTSADRYFCNITKAVINSLFIVESKTTEIRELLTAIQLKTLELGELMAAQVLTESIEAKLPYKEIYQSVKTALDSLVSQRTEILGRHSDKGA
jgi:Rha family phage regulatory protein